MPEKATENLLLFIERRIIIMNYSTRKSDSHGERIVHQFLEEHLYKVLQNDALRSIFGGSEIERIESVTDVARQCLGVDTVIHLRDTDEDILLDEKASVYYINKNLSTFAFELMTKRSDGIFTDGWFVNDHFQNSHYLVMWLKACGKKDRDGNWINGNRYIRSLTVDDIRSVDAFLLDKDQMHTYLNRLGLTPRMLKKKAIEMHNGNIHKFFVNDDIRIQNSGYKASYDSKTMFEEPVNLLLSKSLLAQLADHRFVIKPHELYHNDKLVYLRKSAS